MDALKAAAFSPISVLSDKRSEPRRLSSLPTLSPPPKPPRPFPQDNLVRRFNGGLALLSSVLSTAATPAAKALTYEEALQQSLTSSSSSSDDLLDGIVGFVTENPLVIAGGFAALAVPLVLSQVLKKKPKSWGVESVKSAYTKLGSDENAELLDIRAAGDVRQVGTPNIKGLGKRSIGVVYNGEDKSGFLKKLSLKFKEPQKSTLFILDKYGGDSELVAELVVLNGFKAAYAIKDGVEGPRGWLKSGLPWVEPKKSLSIDLSNLTESISGLLGVEEKEGVSVAVGVAAAAGLGVLAFSEIETILQLLGSAALVQFASKKLLFAEDRKQTVKQVEEFLNTKVAPKELADELKQIGKALLPPPSSQPNKALPGETAERPTTTTTTKAEAEAEAAATSAPPTDEGTTESHPRPLSPYASYPDLKPPASPTPSQP